MSEIANIKKSKIILEDCQEYHQVFQMFHQVFVLST